MMRTFWRWMMVIVAKHCECTKCHRIVSLKMVKMVNFILWISYYNFLKTKGKINTKFK